jgi:pSer/pThr/pTyr-binding forkhead associated (FHA) protein
VRNGIARRSGKAMKLRPSQFRTKRAILRPIQLKVGSAQAAARPARITAFRRIVTSATSSRVDIGTHELGGDIVWIGRAPSNHIVINHSTVSGQHAMLARLGGSYWLKDLNSTNGTQINGVLVTDAELKDGDTIRFGSVMAVFTGRCRKRWSSRWIRKF